MTSERQLAHWKTRFFSIWLGQAFSLFGSSLVGFALVWWLTVETGSATVLAFGTLANILPAILIGPVAGTLVDRWNRRRVMIVADTVIALATFGLALLFAAGQAEVWHVLLLNAIRALGGAFHWPAMTSSTSLMVPEQHLARVAGLNQTLEGLRSVVSPPVAAFLIALMPVQNILLIDLITAAIAVLPLLVVAIPQPERHQAPAGADGPARSSVWMEMAEGLRYIWAWPGVMAIILLSLTLNLLVSPVFSLLPLLATGHFGGGAAELGWMESAWGIGMLLGGLTLSVWGGFKRRAVTSLLAIALQSLGIIALGLAPGSALGLALLGLFFSGFMNPIANGPFFALLQSSVAPEMQGRVFSLIGTGSMAMMPLGLLVIGPLADAIGVRVPFLLAGIITLLLAIGAFFVPAIMHVEDNNRARAASVTGIMPESGS